MSLDLICMGEPMLEYNQLPDSGERGRLYLEGFGGDTSNAAIAAARQGARVGYISAVGRDAAGDRLMGLWKQEGIDVSTVLRSNEHPTAVYFVTHGKHGHDFHYYRRNSAASQITSADLSKAAITQSKMFFASGISQAISASATDAVFDAIALARAHGVRVAYDPNYRPRLWPTARAAAVIHAAIAQADIALPGLEDARALTGLDDPDAIVDLYLGMGPRIVVLKLGEAGALLATPEFRQHVAPFACTPVDATGAGDTFAGCFLARLLAGDAPLPAARYAGVAAALQTQGYGAVQPIPSAAEIVRAMADVEH